MNYLYPVNLYYSWRLTNRHKLRRYRLSLVVMADDNQTAHDQAELWAQNSLLPECLDIHANVCRPQWDHPAVYQEGIAEEIDPAWEPERDEAAEEERAKFA